MANSSSRSKRKKSKKQTGFLSGAGVLILAVIIALFGFGNSDDTPKAPVEGELTDGLSVYMVDVGQGDGLIIHTNTATVVIDGGEKTGADAMIDYLNRLNIDTIDCYVATHPHSDHIGAAPDIFQAFTVKNTVMTEFSDFNMPTTVTYENFLNAVDHENCEVMFVTKDDAFTFGEMDFTVLSPERQTDDYNNMSVVLKMKYGSKTFLFMGDAEAEVEENILLSGADVKADVIKLGHHGSSSSSTLAFIDKVKPSVALISCGIDNKYGHPHRETVSLLNSYRIPFYRTDQSGTVLITCDGTDINVKENA